MFYLLSFIAIIIESIVCRNSDNIIDLTENNFNKSLVRYQSLFVVFHDHSVDESNQILNKFEKSVQIIQQNYLNSVGFAKVSDFALD